jgi:hypothetical protein
MGADNEGNVFAGLTGQLRCEPVGRLPAEMGASGEPGRGMIETA